MNRLKAQIKQIEKTGSFSIIELRFLTEILYVYWLGETSSLKIGNEVTVEIPFEDVFIIKDFNIYSSFSNQLKASILSIESGEYITIVKTAVNGVIFESLLRTKVFSRLNLHVGDSIVLLIPESKILLS